jgi:hypothetical protein
MAYTRTYPSIFTIEIQLKNALFPIWRLVEVKRNCTLHELHGVIQAAMGWKTCHMYQFELDERTYVDATMEDESEGVGYFDSRKIKLYELWDTPGDSMEYTYDLGDNWCHEITLKGLTHHIQNFWGKVPGLLAGAMACPPEDIGGIAVYNEYIAWKLFKTPPVILPEIIDILKDHDIWDSDVKSKSLMFYRSAKRRL